MKINGSASLKVRKVIASNAVASVRIEGILPNAQLEKSLGEYVAGHKTVSELLEETKARYVSLRRG